MPCMHNHSTTSQENCGAKFNYIPQCKKTVNTQCILAIIVESFYKIGITIPILWMRYRRPEEVEQLFRDIQHLFKTTKGVDY